MKRRFCVIVLLFGIAFFVCDSAWAAPKKDDIVKPKEYGVYLQVGKTLKRLLPNIVFEEQKGLVFIESNNPPLFLLKDISLFVIYGTYDISYLTLNPLVFLQQSPVGKNRFIFGKDLEISVTKKGENYYMVKPKKLLGRGYFSIWINDSAWDFVIE